ncbi:phospholipid-transporting ATPase 9-like protein [Trifolium pratense]|uniref:Phospholipid-transporting ATPase n=1 Tax=Trifolium pratense TaxID=57577 RepID=A0A2K3P4N7_TRIPR|nr:phospholipid-transporting ATPase 9-like protein [Trifolium pratense]
MGGGRTRKKRNQLSRIHAFSSGKTSFKGEHSLIGGPGFGRIVYCDENETVSNVVPLVVVVAATIGKEAVEDWRRMKQDIEMNNRKVKVHKREGVFDYSKWRDLEVGDIVKVEKDEFFPADLILLSSSYDDAICYVETMNLDGETNLKLKQALEETSKFQEDSTFRNFKAIIKCEDPNAYLYSFIGNIELEDQLYPLSPQQLLLRDSKLRNTDFIYGVVIFTGHDTKVMQNSTDPPSKRSKVEKRMDKIIYFLFSVLFFISFIGSIFFGIATSEDLENGVMKRWYLRPDDTTIYYNPKKAPIAAMLHFLTALMLYSYLIPISLYVSIEIVKVLQSIFVNHDVHMYYEETDQPARARTSNLNEELGQVDTILSDKTGTLTCNSMEFVKCSIAGIAYGRGATEIERALARRKDLDGNVAEISEAKSSIKGFNFMDERIMNGNWVKERHANVIQKFMRLLAVCHTAIPEVDEETGNVSYEAESPDEAAFVIAAKQLGFEFYERSQTTISLHEFNSITGRTIRRSYKLLNILEFSSARKRMSVIVRDEEGKLLLLSKGADSVMFERLGKNGRQFEEKTKQHINEYADAGLRTLILAYREVDEEEYDLFNKELMEAKSLVSADREQIVEEVLEKIEKDLILLGATAVEDKLQIGVPECIDKLAQAGIKLWVLTGDKMETAINVGFACSLLRQGMKQIIISSDTPDIKSLEKVENNSAAAFAIKANVLSHLREGKELLAASNVKSEALALVIDGKSLTYALEDDVKDLFLAFAVGCASVICCRSSPKQKALVTRLVKIKTGCTTLAIGDGANDVGMLQEADIGIGISGVEGMQAVMSSDIAIAQFRYLERLLLVHGHWCYRRISSMICYFFYKNIAFGITLFLYEIYASFSGQVAYNDWFLSLYNVFFTSLPVIALGVFDQDVSARLCLKFPLLYQEGVQNVLFSWKRILGWAFNGVMSAITVFFFCINAIENQAFRKGGEIVGLEVLGATMYTCVVCVVNCQMALSITYFTYIQHLFIWGGILFWYIFLLIYGTINPLLSTTAYKVLIEACAPAPSYWLITLLVLVASLLPYLVYTSIQLRFFPMFNQMIQWRSNDGHVIDPEYVNAVRQRSIRHIKVGFTARFEASKTSRG